MSVTIKDIARKVGVAPSTVSRVVNGSASISEETKSRILQAMEEMNYHPNSLARNLVNGSTHCIGLIMDARDDITFSNTFFNRSVYAIDKAAQTNGYNLLIANDDNSKGASPVEKLVLERKVDGLILPSNCVRTGLVEMLVKNGCPFVVLGEPSVMKTEACWVDANNEEGARMAVLHLAEEGFQRIAFLIENRKTVFSEKRIAGYLEGLEAAGLSCGQAYIRECGLPENAETAAEEILEEREAPDAFLCSNNVIAYYTLQALKKRGIRIPEDMGVVTFDNHPFAQYMDPPLTAVDVDTFGLGEQAAFQLIHKIKRAESGSQHTLISTRLLVRRSSQKGGSK